MRFRNHLQHPDKCPLTRGRHSHVFIKIQFGYICSCLHPVLCQLVAHQYVRHSPGVYLKVWCHGGVADECAPVFIRMAAIFLSMSAQHLPSQEDKSNPSRALCCTLHLVV